MSKEFNEALKEYFRVLLIAILPVVVVSLESGQLDTKSFIVAVCIAAAKATDKYIHKHGKYNDEPTLTKGLTRF